MSDQDIWDVLDEIEQQESSGGGTLIGEVEFAIGYKVFAAGLGNEASWFPYVPGNKKSQEAAHKKAKACAEENGATSRPQVSVSFRLSKGSAIELGNERAENWQGDRFFTHPVWTPGYKEVVKPALKNAGVNAIGKFWARIAFTPDPSGRQEKDQEGNSRPAMIEHITEIFADQAAAEAAWLEGGGGNSNSPASDLLVPEGYTAETWLSVKSDISGELGDKPKPAEIAKVAKDYGATVPAVKSLLGM